MAPQVLGDIFNMIDISEHFFLRIFNQSKGTVEKELFTPFLIPFQKDKAHFFLGGEGVVETAFADPGLLNDLVDGGRRVTLGQEQVPGGR